MKLFGRLWVLWMLAGKLAAEECLSTDEENVLHPGYEYWYRFESRAFAEAVGTTDDKGELVVECVLHISHDAGCHYYLRLDNCSVTGSGGGSRDNTSWMQQQLDLSRYPIKFVLVGGEVKEVYTDENDPLHFVNIKRGALSAFVVKMSSTKEHLEEMHTDIHGTCPMTSHPVDISEGTVKTSKDMLHCSFPSKKDWQYSPYSLFWNMSFIQHLINSTTDCDYSFNRNERVLKKVFCKERHAIMLESSHHTQVAVQTNIYYTVSLLKFNLQTKKEETSLSRKTGIQFEYERTPDPHSKDLDSFLLQANTMLAHLVQHSKEEISLATIPRFTEFVAHIRTSHTLRTLIASVKSCDYLEEVCTQDIKDLGMSYLIDALVQCNSLPCVEGISHLARSNDISPVYLNLIYFSWSNMHFEKPAIIKYIMNMCIDTDSNLCWMSIGSLIRRTYSEREHLGKEELEKLQEVVRYFPSSVRENCGETTAERTLMKDLKVISNFGKIYLTLIPEGDRQLTECLFKSGVPVQIKISLLEALRSVDPCRSDLSCGAIYKSLLPLLLDEHEATPVRTLTFDYLVRLPQKYGFEGEVFQVLKNDANSQVKSSIASCLKVLFKEDKKESAKFIRAMTQLLTANGLSLDSLILDSKSSATGVPSMSIHTSKVYDHSDLIPRYFHFFTKIFGQLLEGRMHSEGLEDIAIIFQKILKDNQSSGTFSYENFWNAVKEMAKEFQLGPPEMTYKIDIMKNVKKLEELYRTSNPKSRPFFNLFIDLFGTTISYLSSSEFPSEISSLSHWVESLRHGFDLHTTRVLRLIEAYHQVPTMMGLPLNWTTNATLAFALRGGAKVEWAAGLHAKGSVRPSLALTFLNRMVLDFPTITQIGVQANSSGYSCTQLQSTLDYTKEKKLLSIKQPTKSQKILQLYRTNQLIKHDVYQDIADWDIERLSSEWCNGGQSVQFCVSKSYPLVTQQIKPWALMSGECRWELTMGPIDKKLDAYNVQIVKLPGIKNKELIMTFAGGNEKWLTLKGHTDDSEMQYEITGSRHVPFKNIKLLREKSNENGQRMSAILELKENYRYEIIYNEKMSTKERLLSFHTPSNLYRITDEIHRENGRDVKRATRLLYENWNANDNWLQSLLPPSVWENRSKAWMEFQINWNFTSMGRQTVCFVKDPKFLIELDARSLETSGRQQVHFNLTKSEISSSKILAFANVTYDFWSDVNDEEIQLFNVTISRKSWAAKIKTVKNARKLVYDISLKKASMQPKHENTNYVGWWVQEASETFNLDEHTIHLVLDTDTKMVSSQELIDKYSLPSQEIDELKNQLTKAKILLEFPSQWISFDGYFILSKKQSTFRFEEKCVIDSSYNNPQITSHSVYRVEEGDTTFYHQLFTTPSKAEAFHTIDYKSSAGTCWEAQLKHNIKSFFFDLVSNISYKCNSNGLHTLLLGLKTNSSYWQMLDANIEQIVEDRSPTYRYESCNMTHPLLTINVTADWAGEGYKNHKKKAIFTNRKTGSSSELSVLRSDKLLLRWKSAEKRWAYDGDISDDGKKVSVRIKYGNATEESDETKDLYLSGQILDEHRHIWNAKINIDTYFQVKSLLKKGYQIALGQIAEVAQDSRHPLNLLLGNRTLDECWSGILAKATYLIENVRQSGRDTVRSLQPFFETPLSLFSNIYEHSKVTTLKYYENLKETSVLVWSMDYFNVPSYFSMVNLRTAVGYFLNMLTPENRVFHLEFDTGRILAWNSFREWPRIEQPAEEDNSYRTAMIFGGRGVFTFGGKVYSTVSSNCSFLLAHDLRRSEFSVVSDQTSLQVFFPEMSLRINDQVFVNGSAHPAQLPLASHNGRVSVRLGSVLEVRSPSLRIACRDFLCVLQLSKWHRTFGLLSDGRMLANGHPASSLLEFITSYEVSGDEQCQSLHFQPRLTPSEQAREACSRRFASLCSGPESAAFREDCHQEYEEGSDTCYAAAAYSAACYYRQLPTALHCGVSVPVNPNILPRLEVVLMIQEHASLTLAEKKTAPYKGIERLLVAIHDKFQASGYSEVRFALIGFGGTGVHHQPSMHSKGNKWMSLQSLLNEELKSLDFNGHKSTNPLEALKFASEVVGLNTFNSKIFIIVTESDKQSKDNNAIQAIQDHLERNGITLYTLSSYPTIEKGKKVFGVRADGLIFPQKNGTAHLDYPRGDLAKLTSATRGSVFLSKFLVLNSPASFFGEVADEVWAKVRKEAQQCRRCERRNTMWWQELECSIQNCGTN